MKKGKKHGSHTHTYIYIHIFFLSATWTPLSMGQPYYPNPMLITAFNEFDPSYSFSPYLYNISHRLTELNVSLFYFIQLILFKNIQWKQPHINVTAIKLNFIQQVSLQNFLIKQDNF